MRKMRLLLGVAILGLAARAASAQNQVWAEWSSVLSPLGTATGTVNGVGFDVAFSPGSSAGGLVFNGYEAACTQFSSTTAYGPDAKATTSAIIFGFYRTASTTEVTLTFDQPVRNPMIRPANLDASYIEFITTPSALLYTNGELEKDNDKYYDPDGSGFPLTDGGYGTIAFTGDYTEIKWRAGRTSTTTDDGYWFSLSVEADPTSAPTKVPTTAPTTAPTLAPTPAPTIACSSTSQYHCVSSNAQEVCGVEIALSGGPPAGGWTQDACYQACKKKLTSPSRAFLFNFYTGFDDQLHCTCCLDCVQKVPVKAGNVYVTCPYAQVDDGVGALAVSKWAGKSAAAAKSSSSVKFGLMIKNTNKVTVYRDMRLAVDLHPGVALGSATLSPPKASLYNGEAPIVKTVPGVYKLQEAYTNGTTVVWPNFFLGAGSTVKLMLTAKVGASVPVGQTLSFRATLSQTVLGKDACPLTVTQDYFSTASVEKK